MMESAKECGEVHKRNENPQEASPGGFLARHGELVRLGCHCLFVSVQPFAYVVAGYTCYDGDKKCGEYFCHKDSPPFYWRLGSNYSIPHISTFFHSLYRITPAIPLAGFTAFCIIARKNKPHRHSFRNPHRAYYFIAFILWPIIFTARHCFSILAFFTASTISGTTVNKSPAMP